MASTVEGKIHDALYNRCVVMATALQLPLSWRGYEFTPPASGQWVRCEFFPNVSNRITIGSDDPDQNIGLLQIAVHYPHGVGEPVIREKAGEVAGYFAKDLRLTEGGITVRVTKRPDMRELLKDTVDQFIPVSIAWECFA